MRITSLSQYSPSPVTFCKQLVRILIQHEISNFVLVAHSYGTFLATHLLRDPVISPMVSSVVLMDPITFLLHWPDVVYNFVYRKPGPWRANEWMIWYFTSTDLSIATLLSRNFTWFNGVLWKDDEVLQTRQSLVVLSGRDQIVAASRVWKYLTDGNDEVLSLEGDGKAEDRVWENDKMKVIMNARLDHAQIFSSHSLRAPVVKHIFELCTI